jgi:hypothetical protein
VVFFEWPESFGFSMNYRTMADFGNFWEKIATIFIDFIN